MYILKISRVALNTKMNSNNRICNVNNTSITHKCTKNKFKYICSINSRFKR